MKEILLISIMIGNAFFSFGQNLISNPNFENDGELNCQNWYDACGNELSYACDDINAEPVCGSKFYEDSPSVGGNWSLGVTGIGNEPPYFAETYITGEFGTNIYELSLWMKDVDVAVGGVQLSTISLGELTIHNYIAAEGSDWQHYSLIDTLTLEFGDTIVVTVSALAAGSSEGTVYFDQVEFSLFDGPNSIRNVDMHENIKVFPNPSSGIVNFEITDSKYIRHSLSIFNASGKWIQRLENSDNNIVIDNEALAPGLYYYQLISPDDQNILGQGKFVIE